MGKAGKKLPTAMETSRKTRVSAGKQSGPSTMPSSLVSGWTSRTSPKGPPSTPRGAPRSRHADPHQGRPGSLLHSPALLSSLTAGTAQGHPEPTPAQSWAAQHPAHEANLLKDMVSPRGPTDLVGA